MKFSINQKQLNTMLNILNKAVSARTNYIALSGVYIEAEENEVTMRTTNLEFSIQISAPALIEEDGNTLLSATLLASIINSLPDEAVCIEANPESANISCGKSNFNIRVMNTSDFPAFPQIEATQTAKLPFGYFSNMIKKVSKVASKDESRPILQGVNVVVSDGKMELAATDAYRIAIAKQDIDTSGVENFSAVLPASFLSDISGLSGDIENAVISLSENQVVVSCNNIVFINRRIAGNFPNFSQFISQEPSYIAKFKVKDMLGTLRRISALSSTSAIVRMRFDASANIIKLSSDAQDVGSCVEDIECTFDKAEQEVFEISFNCSYCAAGLSSFDDDEVAIYMTSDCKPAIFKEIEKDNFIYVVLPVKER